MTPATEPMTPATKLMTPAANPMTLTTEQMTLTTEQITPAINPMTLTVEPIILLTLKIITKKMITEKISRLAYLMMKKSDIYCIDCLINYRECNNVDETTMRYNTCGSYHTENTAEDTENTENNIIYNDI
jgi:hypothetical protein